MSRRTVLFSPGDRPEMLRKAPTTGADTVVFDLEDAVVPGRKAAAREAVCGVLADETFARDDTDLEICVRVNAGEAGREDLAAILAEDARLDAVMVPKVEIPSDVTAVLGSVAGDRVPPVLALVETASGVLQAAAIAALDPVDALCFGAEDLATDLGATRTAEGTEVLYAREHVLLAARAEGVDAIDAIHPDVEDADGLRSDAEFARRLGYDGKMVVHPSQVPVVSEAFTPSSDEVDWARRVLRAAETARERGRGVARVDGEMVDAPMVTRAERILTRAGADPEA